MSSEPSLGSRANELHDLATDLFNQGERCAGAGLLAQAAALMEQTWSIAVASDTILASSAAWEAGWLHARSGDYRQAADWFGRVDAPVKPDPSTWPVSRETLVGLCLRAVESNRQPPETDRSLLAHNHESSIDRHPPGLNVTNLGRFQIVRDGIPVPNPTSRKPVALFRYLLSRQRRSAPKDELMELLWPDARPREAAHSLHTAVSYLRSHIDPIGDSYLLFDSGSYMLNPGLVISDDCEEFQSAIDIADRYRSARATERARYHYTEGISYYAGDYHVDDSDAVWAVAERERLLTRYLTALDHLGQILMEQGEFEGAVEIYQQLLSRDSFREDIHEQVIHCYLSLGRRGAALRQFETCAAILERDLGLQPAWELQQLRQSIIERSAARRS